LRVLTTLGPALMATQGYASPEAGETYAQARALCRQVYVRAADAGDGLAVLAKVLTCVEQTGERYAEAELRRLTGELLLKQAVPDIHQAEVCFQQALDVARRQQARAWELRAATSLARLWQQHGKCQEGYDLLAPIYGWFTEGFDTADLQDAKALLDEWS
jgi:predicted ATPase